MSAAMTNQTAHQQQSQARQMEQLALTQLLRFNAVVSGLITGIVAALLIFIATNWLVIKGGDVVGPHLGLLGQFFIGYRVSFAGSLIGAAYGFVCGGLIGCFVTSLYNWLLDLGEHWRASQWFTALQGQVSSLRSRMDTGHRRQGGPEDVVGPGDPATAGAATQLRGGA